MNNLFLALNNFIHRFLVLLGLRREGRRWGIVYDSLRKQPLDPVMVKLIDAKSGKVVQSCVTDLAGRYNFLAYPGRFKILVKKSNFIFPSVMVPNDHDGIYDKLYHGELFELSGDSDVIPFNIPMDPAQSDWNQQAKGRLFSYHPFWDLLLGKLTPLLFWFLIIFLGILALVHPVKWVLGVLLGFACLLLLAWVLPRPRLWGRIRIRDDRSPEGLSVELSYPAMSQVVIARTLVYGGGKFFLRIDPGKYQLTIRAGNNNPDVPPSTLYSRIIRVGAEQVINRNIVI